MSDKRHLLAVKRAALLQQEINLDDPVSVGNKQILVNILSFKYERKMAFYQKILDRQTTNIIKPKIPMHIKRHYTHYPHAFIRDVGFPIIFTDDEGVEQTVFANPNVPLYYTVEEMYNIFIKSETDEGKYSTWHKAAMRAARFFIEAKKALRARQVHYAILVNMPNYNTYKAMLKTNPSYFYKLYNALTGFDLLDKYKNEI